MKLLTKLASFLLIIIVLPLICNAKLNSTEQTNVVAACNTVWPPNVCDYHLISRSVAEVVAEATSEMLKCEADMGAVFNALLSSERIVGITFDGVFTGSQVTKIAAMVWEKYAETAEYKATKDCVNAIALKYRSALADGEYDCRYEE